MATDGEIMASIEVALQAWDRDALAQKVANADTLINEFTSWFPLESWAELPLERYALGQQAEGGTVCWWLEFHTRQIASMSGGSSFKHLVFLGSTDGAWKYPKEYGTVEQAWASIRLAFVEMFGAASTGNFDAADDLKPLTGAAALRAKALYMYFPNEIVPVCSRTHVEHFLRALGVEDPHLSPIRANRQLLNTLRSNPALKDLSTQELGYFLYHWSDPRDTVRVVKIAPGEGAKYWNDCLAGNYICVGWDDVGDLTAFEDKAAFREEFGRRYPYNGSKGQVSRKSNEVWTLLELEPGDKVVANRGTGEVLAIGTVNDAGYVWRPDRVDHRHTLGIDWDTTFGKKIEPVKAWATTTVAKVAAPLFATLSGTKGGGSKASSLDPVYPTIEAALKRRGQVILYGPPGTGKTYVARRAAVWLLEGGSTSLAAAHAVEDAAELARLEESLAAPANSSSVGRLTRVTFHPSYSYEDFVEGFRPTPGSAGGLELVMADGVFKRVCDAAAADPQHTYVLLIDEINRGNVPKIFGELITLLEKDKRGLVVTLAQSGRAFSVPSNVLIVGTMNTADRSIHVLDAALRRRFTFVELLPDSELLAGANAGALALDVFLTALNEKVRATLGRERQIGHSLFFDGPNVISTAEAFAEVFRYELLPLLQEYMYEDYAQLGSLLGRVIDVAAETIAADADDPEYLCVLLANEFGANASA